MRDTVYYLVFSFADFLNRNGMRVSYSDAEEVFRGIGGGIDFTDSRQAQTLMKICFCKKDEEAESFSALFKAFFLERDLRRTQPSPESAGPSLSSVRKKDRLCESLDLKGEVRLIMEDFAQADESRLLRGAELLEREAEEKKWDLDFGASENLLKLAKMARSRARKTAEENERIIEERKKVQKEIAKLMSLVHRKKFEEGGSFVTSLCEGEIDTEKRLSGISEEERRKITGLIRKNRKRFMTKIANKYRRSGRMEIDIEKTMKESFKTGGDPVRLFWRKPVPEKANLVLVLDVSGSCASASRMMITFMHALKDVFPGGCRAFAFVNSLYDISDIMSADDPDEAAGRIFETIPTRGEYSDYGRPVRELWERFRNLFRKDSFVIWIGDARNNKNPDAEYEFRKLAERAGRSCWLNTEPENRWGTGDSRAGVYSRYVPMLRTVSVGDMLAFLDRF